jgi:uncharacterized lipoprotein YehR (DUF1307 family)
MNKITRRLALMLSVIMIMTMAACGNTTKENGSEANSSSSESSELSSNEKNSTNTVSGDTSTQTESGETVHSTNKSATAYSESSVGGKDGGSTSTGKHTKTEEAKSKLNFGGEKVTIVYEWKPATEKGVSASTDRWIDRIAEMEQKYNVDIVEKQGAANTDYNGNIVTSIMSGSPVGNIISLSGSSNYSGIRSGAFSSLNGAMEETGIDFSDSIYNQQVRKYFNVNGKQYCFGYGTGDLAALFVYNKRIFEEMKLEDPIELMNAGGWTWGKVTELAKKATIRNNDGTVKQYGLAITDCLGMAETLVLTNGGSMGFVDGNGSPVITMDSSAVRSAFEQLYQWGSVDKVALGNWGNLNWDAIDKEFAKGNIAMISGGAATMNICYQQGMQDEIGVVYPPKGPNASGYVTRMGIGYSYVIPVTYTNQAAKYLLLMDELYQPHEGVSYDTEFRDYWITRFSDSTSYNLYKKMYQDTNNQVIDAITLYGIAWDEPALGTVMGNLFNGSITAGGVIDTYQDTYQNMLNDKFNGFKITGLLKN